jgi:molybdate transport system substrate-binding protein
LSGSRGVPSRLRELKKRLLLKFRSHMIGAYGTIEEQRVTSKMRRTGAIAAIILAGISVMAFLYAQTAPAQTPDLRIFCSDGMKAALVDLTPQIEHVTGRHLLATFDSSKNIEDKIQSGEAFDVAILTTDSIDKLIQQGKLVAGTRADLAKIGMGVGVRSGAPKPDISTSAAMKQTLLRAKSISFNPTGAAAAHINDMLARLGIADETKSKIILDGTPGGPQKQVAEKKAEIVITLIPEIKFFQGVDLVGPLPAEFQSYIAFAAAVATNTHDADTAKATIKFITSPGAASAMKAKGADPL